MFIKKLFIFLVVGNDVIASDWCWGASLHVRCLGTLRVSKMKIPFLRWYHLRRSNIFQFFLFFGIILIFFRCKDNVGYLGLMLVCSIMGGGVERFFKKRYHIFARAPIHVLTHVTIILGEFCTVSNGLLFLSCLCIDYFLPYLHFQWNRYITVWFSTRYHALISIFLKKKYINVFSKN